MATSIAGCAHLAHRALGLPPMPLIATDDNTHGVGLLCEFYDAAKPMPWVDVWAASDEPVFMAEVAVVTVHTALARFHVAVQTAMVRTTDEPSGENNFFTDTLDVANTVCSVTFTHAAENGTETGDRVRALLRDGCTHDEARELLIALRLPAPFVAELLTECGAACIDFCKENMLPFH